MCVFNSNASVQLYRQAKGVVKRALCDTSFLVSVLGTVEDFKEI